MIQRKPLRWASTSLATDATGAEVPDSRTGYYPYGEVRYGGSGSPTDYGFTGQRSEGDALGGLMDYNARFYDPYLNRFISPDTIVPDPANPQSLNRYSYVYNNSLKHIDSDGHIPVPSPMVDGLGSSEAVAHMKNSTNLYEPPTVSGTCSGPLADCFGEARRNREDESTGWAMFVEGETVKEGEFEQLLEVVSEDLKTEWTPPVILELGKLGYGPGALAGRDRYDTPFYNGYHDDIEVCVEEHGCWQRSEINYFAQGMWGARSHESLEDTLAVVEYWNQTEYGHPAWEGELYWTEFGWKWAHERMFQDIAPVAPPSHPCTLELEDSNEKRRC